MIAFVDNDVIAKLAACDLLGAVPSILPTARDQVFVGPDAPFSLYVRKNRPKGVQKHGAEIHERICAFVEGANVATGEPLLHDITNLSSVDGIDPGEAILLALCARTSESIFVTGDKRAIRALGSATGLEEIRAALQGRVYCLECVIRLAIEHLGFAMALPRIVSGCKRDTVLGIAFASGLKTTAKNADEGLRSYEEELRKEAAGLLCERGGMPSR